VSFVYTKFNENSSVASTAFVETRGHNHNAKPDFLIKRNNGNKKIALQDKSRFIRTCV
jgi:hypothetical protein